MERLDENFGKSEDLIANNIEQLKQLFPEAFTEGKIDFEVLKQLLGEYIETNNEKYGLNWFGKKKARQFALTPSLGTLRPCPEDSVDWETTKNIMIEGDNLEVLKLLQKFYNGRVGLIYIDPPYNTGKDFVYPDNYKDSISSYLEMTGQIEGGSKLGTNVESSGRFHTDWLNMMYPRLYLAYNLLNKNGVIFISINDTELRNLLFICNNIFGEGNFVELFTVRSNPRGNQAKKLVASEHDYIVCYAKDIESIIPLGFSSDAADYNKTDALGSYREIGLRKRGAGARRIDAPNQYYPIYFDESSGKISTKEIPNSICILPYLSDGTEGRWRWADRTVEDNVQKLLVRQVRRGDGYEYDVFEKDYYTEEKITKIKSIFYEKEVNYENATEELSILLGPKVFSYPKPVYTIRKLIESVNSQDAIVVDFFAGSGTTGHATILQNAIDGGNRRYILVQLPEYLDPDNAEQISSVEFCDSINKPKYLTEITKERLRRAGAKVIEESQEFNGDVGFRVFKLDSSNIRAWDPSITDIEGTIDEYTNHVKSDRSEQDILFELLLKLGLDLSVQIDSKEICRKKVYNIGFGVLLVCLSTSISSNEIEPLAQGMIDWIKAQNPETESVIIFRDSAFENDVAKANITAIFNQHGFSNIRSL
ncbi:DNA methylase [anaerobic digester metagenome]